MNKKDVKYLKQLADRLPVVYDQTVSGYYEDYNEAGETQLFPNIVNHPINHVRRLRKTYETLGMEGVRSYLEMIHKLQIQRNENFQRLEDLRQQEEQVGDNLPDGGPVLDNTETPDLAGKGKPRGRKKKGGDSTEGTKGTV
jgi:hypothetical protein